jgi:MFS family permease
MRRSSDGESESVKSFEMRESMNRPVDEVPVASSSSSDDPNTKAAKPSFFNCVDLVVLLLFSFFFAIPRVVTSVVVYFAYVSTGEMSVTSFAIVNAGIGCISIYLDILVSSYGDKVVTPYGRRKPFCLAGVLFTCAGATIMCTPATNGVTAQYAIASLLASLGSAFYDNSFNSWIIEVLPHEAEYVRVSAYLSFASILGALPTAIMVYIAGSDPQEILTIILWAFLPPNLIFTVLLMYRVRILFYCSSFFCCCSASVSLSLSLSLSYPSIAPCLHSPTPHGTSLTIISSPPQSIINRHNTHMTYYYLTGTVPPCGEGSSATWHRAFCPAVLPEQRI